MLGPLPIHRLSLAAGLLAGVGLLGGGVVAAAAATPSASPSTEKAAEKAADRAGREKTKAARKASPAGPAFVCDPALSHGQNVSAYARSLPKGPGRGRLVSQAARSDCGKDRPSRPASAR